MAKNNHWHYTSKLLFPFRPGNPLIGWDFWSFHLINTNPAVMYAEIVFAYSNPLIPVGPGGAKPLTIELQLKNLIAVTAGYVETVQPPGQPSTRVGFDFTGADLDEQASAALGSTILNINNGVAKLGAVNLNLVDQANKNNFFTIVSENGPTITASMPQLPIGPGSGEWQLKNQWSFITHAWPFDPSLTNPPVTSQPSPGGEFVQ
jgi:hypothetical protein